MVVRHVMSLMGFAEPGELFASSCNADARSTILAGGGTTNPKQAESISQPAQALHCCPVLRVIIMLSAAMCGCATSRGPEVLVIPAGSYAAAFDAAVAAAADVGMKPSLLDRRSGVIETDSAVAGSIMEPWKPRAASARDALENTLSLQRRSARFEFRHVEPELPPEREIGALRGPDVLAEALRGGDLTNFEGALELRVWVYVDRFYRRGVRQGSWTMVSQTVSREMPSDAIWEQSARQFWRPVARDVAGERSLLAEVETTLGR